MYKLLIFFLLCSAILKAQDIAAFSDYQKEFFVFDKGNFRNLERMPVVSFAVGDKCIGYYTEGNHFKAYYNHIVYDIAALIDSYKVTNYLVSYNSGGQLYVFDNGVKHVLTKFVGNHRVGDSIIGFFDLEDNYLKAYYQGKTIPIADGNISGDSVNFVLGDNMIAFTNTSNEFIAFYQGEFYNVLSADEPVSAKIGRSVMSYIDPMSEFFYVFFKGEVIEMESFLPISYKVGYEKVAYIDNMEGFKLFDNGTLYTVSDFPPEKYMLDQNTLVYHMQGQLWMFKNGNNILIENYIPTEYKFKNNRVVYFDHNGYLNLFENGERTILSYEQINDFEVYNNVIVFNQGMNTTKIYFGNKMYTK